MKVAIITVAGISSRFNKGIEEENKVLKCLYTEESYKETLLYHLLDKVRGYDKTVIVGGYKYADLERFYNEKLADEFPDSVLTFNEHFEDLSSGYSLYLGLKKAFEYAPSEILFVEGDLDIDDMSFDKVIKSDKAVLTYTGEPIYANKAVVLYCNGEGKYRYAFNSAHGLLTIDEPFSCILNSGQTWKFTNIEVLQEANEEFVTEEKEGTNLGIIQRYVEREIIQNFELVPLDRWTNCNTREDYRMIADYWRDDK